MPLSFDDLYGSPQRPASTGRLSLDDIYAEEEEPEYGWLDTAVTTGLRVVPSILGNVGGGFAGAALGGVGAPAGVIAGGAVGGGVGDWLAQQYERARGLRDDTSLASIVAESVLGGIPLGKSATIAKAAVKGAGMGAGGTALHSVLEEGELPGVGETALSALFGAGFGAGGERLFGGRGRSATVEPPPNTFNELSVDDIAARHAAVPRSRPDTVVDEIIDEVYRYDEQPRLAPREPNAIGQGYLPDRPATQEPISPLGPNTYDADEIAARTAPMGTPTGQPQYDPRLLEPPTTKDPYAGPAADDFRVYADTDADIQAGIARERALLDDMEAQRAFDDDLVARLGEEEFVEGLPTYPIRERGFAPVETQQPQMVGDKRTRPYLREQQQMLDADRLDEIRRGLRMGEFRGAAEPPRTVRGRGETFNTPEPDLPTDIEGLPSPPSLAASRASVLPPDTPTQSFGAFLRGRAGDETGEIGGELAQTLGSGAVGAAVGATYGDTPEEHIGGAVAGFGAGAAGASALQRFMRARPKPPAPEFYHERPLPTPGKPIPPIRSAATPTGKYIIENDHQVFEFEPRSNALPPRQTMPKAQADDLGLKNFPEESRDAIGEVIAEFDPDDIARQRGGRQPIEHTRALAERMKLDAEKAIGPGKNLPRAGHMAVANAFHATAMEARELGRKQRAEGLNDRELARFVIVQQANRALGMSYFGLRSEAGGSLNVYRHLKKLMPGEVRLLTELIDRGRLRKDMADLGNLYADLPDDPVKAFERLREIEASQRSTMDKVTSYYTSNILSGVKTQLRNVLGNTSRLIARLPAKASAGALDAFLAKAQGRGREVYATEVKHELQGLYAGLGNAWRDGVETLKLGFSPTGLREGLEDLTSLHVPRVEFGGGLKNPLNLPGRGMAAADRFFRQLNVSMELHGETYARARRAAEGQGLTGAAFTDAVASSMAEQRMNPSRELRARVSKAAERAVYQNEPGPAIRALGAFIKHVPLARFAAPFLGTVHQIVKQGAIDFGPAGFLRTAARTGELRDQMGARGEALAGTLALFPIAMMAATGGISGAGPTDPRKRDELYESGWRPHSIRVPGGSMTNAIAEALGASRSDDGDWWVNYTLVQPIAVQAAIVANGFEAWQERQEQQKGKSNPDELESLATSTMMRAAQSAFDQSFLSGVGDLIDAINDPHKGQQFFGRLAQGFLPLSGLQRNIAQAIDPVVRAPEGIGEHLAANIPFASTTVDPRLNRWGEDVTRTGFGAMLVPEAQPVNRDPVADELSRLGVNLGRPSDRLNAPKQIGGGPIKMDDATALEIRRFKGRTTRAMLHAVVGSPGYENLPDVARAELLRKAIGEASSNAGDAARMSLLIQRPDLLRLLAEPVEEAAAASYSAR